MAPRATAPAPLRQDGGLSVLQSALGAGRSVVPNGVLTLKTPPFTVPAGTTNLQIGLMSFGGMTID
jgi:hypothetical protein